MFILFFLLLPFSALQAAPPKEGYEDFTFIGWSEACAVAVQHVRYPAEGQGIEGEPNWSRVGAITLDPEEIEPEIQWTQEQEGNLSWRKVNANDAIERLVRTGYNKPGHVETIREESSAKKPGVDFILRSTATFQIRHYTPWPPAPFSLSKVFYSPLGTCGLLLFHRRAAVDAFRYKLLRLKPDIRRLRAKAHVTNGLLLYKGSDLDGALAELAIASDMDPNFALARYSYAHFLALAARFDEALEHLQAAVNIDRHFAERARKAPEFEDIRSNPRFISILKTP